MLPIGDPSVPSLPSDRLAALGHPFRLAAGSFLRVQEEGEWVRKTISRKTTPEQNPNSEPNFDDFSIFTELIKDWF